MFKTITILSVLVAAVFGGTVPQWEGRVVGGRDATVGQFPFAVSIRTSWGSHFCGGTVVTSRFVISAAHCFQDGSGIDDIVIYIGSHRRNGDDGIRMNLLNIVPHPDYNKLGQRELDAAVLQTDRNIPDWQMRQIPLINRIPRVNEDVTVIGWGRSFSMPGQEVLYPTVLQYLTKRVIDRAECARYMGRVIPVTAVCTSSPFGQGSCQGDSGGPLVSTANELLGIVSWGIPCARGYPDMYGNVYEMRTWLNNKMRDLAS